LRLTRVPRPRLEASRDAARDDRVRDGHGSAAGAEASARRGHAHAGKPFPVVAWQLGHASSKITATVYEHLLDGALLDDALEAFDRPRIAHRIAQADELEAEEVENRLQ
jgi:integrase